MSNKAYGLTGRTSTLLSGDQQGDLSILSAKADYVRPLARRSRLEAGAKISLVSSDNDVVFRLTEVAFTTIDRNRSNRYRYDETITAAYLNWNRSFATTNVQVSLRMEYTLAQGY